MEKSDKKEYPNILVISNNPFSKTSNNGKTLASFFKAFPKDNIAQLYFNAEIAEEGLCENYYRISDVQVLKSIIFNKKAGGIVNPGITLKSNFDNYLIKSTLLNLMSTSNFFRLLREIMWKCSKWKSNEFITWLNDFSPDIIFFCAGDSIFAYEVSFFVKDITEAKLVTYITDDYVLPRENASMFWQIRRKFVFKHMNQAVKDSSLFITISEQMKDAYKNIFGKESVTALNMTDSMKIDDYSCDNLDEGVVNFIYAGGLHFKRYETLKLLAEALRTYNNQSTSKKAFLSIYSTQTTSKRIINMLNVNGASSFCGGLSPENLKIKLNKSDIPVHVESFDSKSIESTKLSISTKIPEYLSLEKPILAIGPSEVASMRFLSDTAFCITQKDEIYEKIDKLLNDEMLINELSKKSKHRYNDYYRFTTRASITEKIVQIYKDN